MMESARNEALDEPYVVQDAATLKVLGEPLRLRVLLEFAESPRTVKEVASALGVPATRLYYHVRILERRGLVRIVARRLVSGIEERTYEAVSKNYTIAPHLMASPGAGGVVGAALNVVRTELELALATGGPLVGEADGPVPVIVFTRLALDPAEVVEVQQILNSVMTRFGDTGRTEPGKAVYHALLTAYRAPSELGESSASQ